MIDIKGYIKSIQRSSALSLLEYINLWVWVKTAHSLPQTNHSIRLHLIKCIFK